MKATDIQKELKNAADPEKAKLLMGYFKTGPGQYGEGDVFRGVMMPVQRGIAKKNAAAPLSEVLTLLKSKHHEDRMVALLILVIKYQKGTKQEKREIYETYINNTDRINNWDLIDVTVGHIVGDYVLENGGNLLEKFSKSKSMWERRIAIIATGRFIKEGKFEKTLNISKTLLHDEEDLIHKATGWMLREVGKRDMAALEGFLKEHYKTMPRTMLRYAIEKFPEKKRQAYLKGTV